MTLELTDRWTDENIAATFRFMFELVRLYFFVCFHFCYLPFQLLRIVDSLWLGLKEIVRERGSRKRAAKMKMSFSIPVWKYALLTLSVVISVSGTKTNTQRHRKWENAFERVFYTNVEHGYNSNKLTYDLPTCRSWKKGQWQNRHSVSK